MKTRNWIILLFCAVSVVGYRTNSHMKKLKAQGERIDRNELAIAELQGNVTRIENQTKSVPLQGGNPASQARNAPRTEAHSPRVSSAQTNPSTKCVFCGGESYGPSCPFSTETASSGSKKVHKHNSGNGRCVYCRSESIGNGCPYSPSGNHLR